MSQTIKDKAKADLEALGKQLMAKKHLLQEVFCDLEEIGRTERRQMVGETIGIEPRTSSTCSNFCTCTFLSVTGFEDFVCVVIQVRNSSAQCYAIIQGRPYNSNAHSSSLLVDINGAQIERLPPGEDGTLFLCFPQYLLINVHAPHIIIYCNWTMKCSEVVSSWISNQLIDVEEVHPFESIIILVPNLSKWLKLDDVRNCTEEEACLIKTLAAVCFHSHQFRQMSLHDVREIFPQFEICDYGCWQLLIGREGCSGMMLASSCNNNGMLDTVYGRCPTQINIIISKLLRDDSRI